MAGLGRIGAVLALLILPAPGFAFGWRSGWWETNYYYYYPPPVFYVPPGRVVDPCAGAPAVTTTRNGPGPQWYAKPSPAPPSATAAEPPLAPPASANPNPPSIPKETKSPLPVPESSAGITESKSYYDAYVAAVVCATPPVRGKAKIGFWNLSPRDLTLTVDGQVHLLKKGRSLKLELDRQFVWKVGEHKPQMEQVPDQVPGLELVIRK
jgi:hypothetical protein